MRFIQRLLFSMAFVVVLFGLAGAQGSTYTVQFEAAPTKEEAEEKVRQLKDKSVSAYIVRSSIPGKGTFFRVRAGVFSTLSDAKKFGAALQQRGAVSEFVVMAYEKPTEDVASGAARKGASQAPATSKAAQPAPSNVPSGIPQGNALATNSPITGAQINAPVNSAPNPATNPATSPSLANNSTNNAALNSGIPATPSPAGPPSGFLRFKDPRVGFAFDYPDYWTGQPLSDKEANDQRMSAGAMYSSQKDAAFLTVVWNELDKANNPATENDIVIEIILKSMSSTDGISRLEETARRVETRNGVIKTYLDLRAAYQTPGQNSPLDFLAKAVIVRANRGILLVAAFYSKESPSNAIMAANQIIASVRAPE